MARGISVKIEPSRDAQFKISKLASADVKKKLRSRITRAVAPMPATAKASALRIGGGQLSQDLARAVGKSISIAGNTVSAQIFIKATGNLSNLARVVEGVIPWHHPTFGHDPIEFQHPMPFFFRPLVAQDPRVAHEIEQAIDDIGKSL